MAGVSPKDLAKVIKSGAVTDCPITASDVWRAQAIYGRDLAAVRGKTRREKTVEVWTDRTLILISSAVVGYCDIFFVVGLPFLLCVVEPMQYVCVHYLAARSYPVLKSTLIKIVGFFKSYGFSFNALDVDGEGGLVALENDLNMLGIKHDVTAKEPVSKAENKIEQLKERARGIIAVNPFTRMASFIVYLMLSVTWGLNCVPSTTASEFISSEAVTGRKSSFEKDFALDFCEYVEIHAHNDVVNDMTPRTKPAIALFPKENKQGTWVFWTMDTKRLAARDRWTRVPMPAAVISFMNQLANDDGFASKHLTFRLGRADGHVFELDGDGTQTEAPPIEDRRPLAEERPVADLISIDPELDAMEPQSAVDLEPRHHHVIIDSQAKGVESEIVDGEGGEGEATDEGVRSVKVRDEGVLADINYLLRDIIFAHVKSAGMEST